MFGPQPLNTQRDPLRITFTFQFEHSWIKAGTLKSSFHLMIYEKLNLRLGFTVTDWNMGSLKSL